MEPKFFENSFPYAGYATEKAEKAAQRDKKIEDAMNRYLERHNEDTTPLTEEN
jgi:hypothetical protein